MSFTILFRNLSFRMAALSAVGLLLLSLIAGGMLRSLLEQDRIDLARSVAETARSLAASYDLRAQKGEFSLEEAQRRAKNAIRDIRYLNNQYVFVVRTDGIMQVHGAIPSREGQSFVHEKDAKGFDFPPSLIAKAMEGGGHTFYHFARPGSDEPSRKVSYTVLYEPWQWVFGTGIYIDDIEQIFWRVMRYFTLFAGAVILAVSSIAFFASKQLLSEIDKRRRAEKEALHASKLASIGQLAAGLAHEINTPVQYVGDNLRYLGSEEETLLKAIMEGTTLSQSEAAIVSEELSAAVREGLEGVERISKIVNSLKAFSLSGAGEKTEVDVNKALEDTLVVSQHAWRSVAETELRIAQKLPSYYCRPGELNQVFLNIILNSVEAIKSSGKPFPGHILIESFEQNGNIVIRISDNGTGIPEAARERIFDPFYSTKQVGMGTGQGLAISRDVIEVKLGGHIAVGGTVGEGAIFTITLPCRHDA